jgi:hypothetical protein
MSAHCVKCDRPLSEKDEYCPHCKQKNPDAKVRTFSSLPGWGWVFVVACGVIPVITLGGAVPALLGIGGAAVCATLSKRPNWPTPRRVLACAGVTVGAWFLFLSLRVAFAALWRW